MDFSTNKIILKKLGGSNMDFSTIKITLEKLGGKSVYFLTREITSKKVCGNNVGFSTREISSKKVRKKSGFFDQRNYMEKVRENDVEVRRNLVFNISRQCRHIIDVDLTCCAHVVILFIKLSTESVYLICSNT